VAQRARVLVKWIPLTSCSIRSRTLLDSDVDGAEVDGRFENGCRKESISVMGGKDGGESIGSEARLGKER